MTDIREPAPSTLAKYGITLEEWWAFIPDGVCPVCDRRPQSGRFVVDHEHVRGWKAMPAEQRKLYVRGVLCVTCNHYILTRYGTPLKHRNAARYLEAYEARRK